MANDFGILIRADVSEITADVISEIEGKLYAVIQGFTTTTEHNKTYSASGTDDFTVTLSAGGAVTVDWAFRIGVDSTVSKKRKLEMMRKVFAILSLYTVDALAGATPYAAGTPDYQVEVTISA